jgi:transcriptional regulator with XRE-family HTH domain
MGKTTINQILAKNLKAAMEARFDGVVNQSELARVSGVSQKSISNLLHPENREKAKAKDGETEGKEGKVPSTSLATLVDLAKALNVEVWELLHPNLERSRREHQFYQQIDRAYKKLPPLGEAEIIEIAQNRRKGGKD